MIPGLCLELHLHLLLLLLVGELESMVPLFGLQPEGSKFDAGLCDYLSEALPEGGPVVGGSFPALAGHAGAVTFFLNSISYQTP